MASPEILTAGDSFELGHAKHHISKSPPPPVPTAPPLPVFFSSDDIGRGEYQPTPQEPRRANSQSTTTVQVSEKHTTDMAVPTTSHQPARQGHISHTLSEVPQTIPAQGHLTSTGTDLELGNGNSTKPVPGNANYDRRLTRQPPEKPVLRPETRYCFTEGFVKPVRTHHCRACGTVCVMTLSTTDLTYADRCMRSAFSNTITIVLVSETKYYHYP